jgi:acyl-CoA reductase-like NAD-dependent aldehyde dehydrogenase
VIRAANDTDTGLAACVWSSDIGRAKRIADRIEAGSVFINSHEMTTPKAVFSGHKQSGIGSEWGSTGLLGFCNVKVTHIFK